MDAQGETRLVTIRFYVRPSRTLVSQTVLPGVGGRVQPLWAGGGRLDLGAGDLGEVPAEHLPVTLCRAMLEPHNVTPMTREQRAAWQRSWRPGGP